MSAPLNTVDQELAGFSNGESEDFRFRAPMEADELLWAASRRLLDRAPLPTSLRNRLGTLKDEVRRSAARKSGFGTVLEAMNYASHPADALWLSRLMEGQVYGRGKFPTLPREIAHSSESESNGAFDFTQIQIQYRRSPSTLDELLYRALVQETATRAVAISEASEYRVRSVLMGR